jgi:hypothetical protein
VVRLLGQATSGWTSKGLEMHGQAIRLGSTPISPWSTENTPWEIQTVPLWTDAVHKPTSAGNPTYSVTMHGVLTGVGGAVIATAGHLYAMRFVQVPAGGAAGLQQLSGATQVDGPSSDTSLAANAGYKQLLSHPLGLKSGDRFRVTGYLQLAYPSSFNLGISCTARLRVTSPSGSPVATASPAMKYITQQLEVLPLRLELIGTASTSGAHPVELSVACTRQSYSPTLTVMGGRTKVLVETYRSLGP